ncbi:MAG: type II secretion system protein J [Desulfamplus sp.]
MKTLFLKNVNTQKGFTLVELLVAIAVLSIVAA